MSYDLILYKKHIQPYILNESKKYNVKLKRWVFFLWIYFATENDE